MQITDWDDAYANGAYIEGGDQIVAGWEERAGAFRAAHGADEIRYGPGARNYVDLYRPEQAEQGLTVIVHGGYWMAFDGRDFAHLCAGALARGQAVGAVTYTLAPGARIAEITAEAAAAVTALAGRVEGPIRLAGHSAGGHLVTRMICAGVLPPEVAERIELVLSISGLHDLRPLLRTGMNETLRLDAGEAVAESAALAQPIPNARLICVAGAKERPEFLRQNALLPNVWRGLGADTEEVVLPGEDHFSIIAGLETPEGALTRLLIDQVCS